MSFQNQFSSIESTPVGSQTSSASSDLDALIVKPQSPAPQTPPKKADGGSLNVFITGIPAHMNEKALEDVLKQHGEIVSSRVMVDARTGRGRGFGFALFANIDEGFKAIRELSGKNNNGCTLYLSVSQHSGQVNESEEIFVRNIPNNTEVAELRAFFGTFGTIESFELRCESTGLARNLAIRYRAVSEAQAAIKSVHGSRHFSSELPMLAKFAETIETRMSRRYRRTNDDNQQSQQKNHKTGPMMASAPQAAVPTMMQQPVMMPGYPGMMPAMMAPQPMPMFPQQGMMPMMVPMQPGMMPTMMAPQPQQMWMPTADAGFVAPQGEAKSTPFDFHM